MRKGIFRIISGFVLIVLQILSWIGNYLQSTSNYYNYLYENQSSSITALDIGMFLGDNAFIIIGILLLIFGFKAYNSKDTATVVLHSYTKKSFTVIKYISFFLLLIRPVFQSIYIFENISYVFNVSFILDFILLILIFIYLLFYINKNPCFLFSAALLFEVISYIYSSATTLNNSIYCLDHINFFFAESCTLLLLGIIYIILAIKLYKEKFSSLFIKILGYSSLAVYLITIILEEIYYFKLFNSFVLSSISIVFSLIMPVFFFVYTVIFSPTTDNKIIKIINERNENATVTDIGKFSRSYPKPKLSNLNDAELCPVCGADISSDNENCHVCGANLVG